MIRLLVARAGALGTVALICVVALSAQPAGLSAQSGRVAGRVWKPNGRPAAGAQVALLGTPLTSLTNASGQFLLPNVPPGSHTLRVMLLGYAQVQLPNVLVQTGVTTQVRVGLGPRPPNWRVLQDSLLLGPTPPRRILLYVDSLGVVPTPGNAAHRRAVADSAAARGLSLVSDTGGVMVFGIPNASSWDTLAARDTAFGLAHALRRDLPTFVKQAGPVVRYRPGGPPSVATDEVVVRFDSTLSPGAIDSLNARVRARVVNRNPFVTSEFLVQAEDHDGAALSNAYWSAVGPPAIRSAYPNFRFRTVPTAGSSNDPLSGSQWHLKRINAAPAWPLATSVSVIAVIESDGFEVTHPDLRNQLWTNSLERGADQDGNGLVGDVHGWNFADCSAPAMTATSNQQTAQTATACGSAGLTTRGAIPEHGTAVAGLVAAEHDNLGVAGVCPKCRLMPIVVDKNDGNSQRLGFLYAQKEGAQAVNLSWVLAVGTEEISPDYLAVVTDLAKTRVVVSSAGNYNRDYCTTPGAGFQALPDVIVVGASNERDKRLHAGYGDCLTMLAPGGRGNELIGITTTDVTGAEGFNDARCGGSDFGVGSVPGRDYTRCFGGTSAAAPIVTGVVGLMLGVDPSLTGPRIKPIFEQTADRIDAGAANYDDAGKSTTHGYGRVNACAAVRFVAGDPNWRDCAVMPPWFCHWWLFLIVALVVAVVVCFILSRAAANAPAPAHGQPFWVRLVLSALAGAVAWLLLWLFCQLLVLWFCVLAGLVVAVIVFVVRRTGWVWRLVVSLLAGGATFAILWLLLRDRV